MSEWRKVLMGGEEVDFDFIKEGDVFQLYLGDLDFQLAKADGDAFAIGSNGNAGVKCSLLAFGSDEINAGRAE